jgi:DNA invertase Pin-like site-specific DNA recombinase
MYLRQSKDKYGNEVRVDDQRTDLTKLCIHRDWTWTEYKDNDYGASGRMPGSTRAGKKRPAFLRMVRDIKAGKLDAICVWDADRLVRHPRELEDIIDLADIHGLELATVSGGDFDLSTPTGRANARMKGVFARQEMEQKAMRQKDANGKRVPDERAPWWPTRPFGYDAARDYTADPENGVWWTVKRAKNQPPVFNPIRKHPTEAKLVVAAYRRFNTGTTVRTIATGWNAKGIKTPLGNRWTGVTVRALLLAARNASFERGRVGKGIRRYTVEGRDDKGRVTKVEHEVEGTWPALVSRAVWEQAVRKLEDPRRRRGTDSGRKYLLSGIALCGLCGKPLGCTMSSRGTRQYACVHCHRINRAGEKLDALIIETVVRRLSKPDAVNLLRPAVDPVDAQELEAERAALQDKLVALGKEYATAPAVFRQSALNEIQQQLAAIDAQLQDPGQAEIFEGVIGAKDVRKAFTGLDLGRRRTIVSALMTVTVKPVGKRSGAVFNPDAIDVKRKR